MITNAHQLKISQQRLKELHQALSQLKEEFPKPHDFEFYSLGAREHIDQIKKEINDYLSLDSMDCGT